MHHISVIGAGTMGNGIAHCFAQHGFNVSLVDTSKDALQKAMQTISVNIDRQINKQLLTPDDKTHILSRISTNSSLENAVNNSDLVVEAIIEDEQAKMNLFRQLDNLCKPSCILASNTSSISVTKLASCTNRTDKVVGMHFMNPVPVMKLIEVVRAYRTSDETMHQIEEIAKTLDKIPVRVNDYPGFISNRILMPTLNEAIYALYERVAGVEEIDTIMKLGMAHPMGPLQLADFIGLDVCLSILNVLYKGFGNPKYAPCPLLVNMVQAGYLGVKTLRGFYYYTPDKKPSGVAV
ncbi:MAG: 3-hydroxyacyl-CoA dehydrogenase NAD-binding domain-containing protein [Cytophagaceae bacterium]|nr:3-hydroxyacyl-CoA dehydrogenase NAD-binding domain-containing protein [Cytophagaceae bacterium]MDW8456890.1 3-hydroxyacyl-CoA dehydrogenase NAD-binding domain-containing protein [Cytophagaceae bacterium]